MAHFQNINKVATLCAAIVNKHSKSHQIHTNTRKNKTKFKLNFAIVTLR